MSPMVQNPDDPVSKVIGWTIILFVIWLPVLIIVGADGWFNND